MLTLKTWNGNSINDGTNYAAIIPEDAPLLASVKPNSVKRSESWPVYAGKALEGIKLPIVIAIRSGSLDQLKAWFNTEQQDLFALVANDGTEDWYLEGTVTAMEAEGSRAVTVVLFVADPVWRSVTEYSSSWSVTASGQTKAVTPGGTVDVYPVYEITPGSGSGGYAYRRFIKIWNKLTEPFEHYPLDITSGGLDTAALVTASHMLANGDDIRVMVDGVETPRWLNGMNTSLTNIWIVLSLAPKIALTLGVAIPSSGAVGEITIQNTTANISALKRLPSSGIVDIEGELFIYKSVDIRNRKLGSVERAVKDSSMAGHALAAAITWIEHDIWLIYGNAAATAPDQDNSAQPIFSLAASSNTNWVYSDFADNAGLRAGSWKPTLVSSSGKVSHLFSASLDASADPASVMGMKMDIWYLSGRVRGETARLGWSLHNPAKISTLAASGNKQRSGTKWPALAALQKSVNGVTWATVWNETIPADLTLTAWNRTMASLATKFAWFCLSGSLAAIEGEGALFEVGDVTVVLDSAGVPGISLASENVQTWLEIVLKNTTSLESINLRASVKTGKLVQLDTNAKTVLVDGQNQVGALGLSSIRRDWLKLASSLNTLEITYTQAPTLSVVIKWHKRML